MIPNYDFTVANTINVAVAIYRNNLKKFFKLSLVAHLWLLVPVYGWARYFAIAAWISKLSFQELNSSSNVLESKHFFRTRALLVLLATGIFAIVVPALLSFFAFVCAIVLYVFLEQFFSLLITASIGSIEDNILEMLLGLFFLFFLLIASAYFYARFFVSDLVFVDNKSSFALNLIGRSYKLTKRRGWKIFKTIVLSFIIVFPVWATAYILVSFIAAIIFAAFSYSFTEDNLSIILSLMFFIFFSANLLTMPLWQSVKSVAYHDLNEQPNWSL